MINGASESSSGNEKNSQLFFLEEGQNWQTLTLHRINLAHTNHKQQVYFLWAFLVIFLLHQWKFNQLS
jgi:hypothetical protein